MKLFLLIGFILDSTATVSVRQSYMRKIVESNLIYVIWTGQESKRIKNKHLWN